MSDEKRTQDRPDETAPDRPISQAAGRAASLITNFLVEFDPQPIADALALRLGLGDDPSVPVVILFSNLAGATSWALRVGNDPVLELLREFSRSVEPQIARHGGRLVKRLGAGHMAVFASPREGVDAALAMQRATAEIEVEGYRPSLSIGLHRGTPQKVAGDYLGTDVNIAARLAEAAAGGELLSSGQIIEAIEPEAVADLKLARRRGFRAKGTPPDLQVYAISRR